MMFTWKKKEGRPRNWWIQEVTTGMRYKLKDIRWNESTWKNGE